MTENLHAAPPTSHFPQNGAAQFLAERFDLASIRSSFGPRRTPAQRTFADFGMKPSKVTENAVIFETPGDWRYELHILARGDVNGDGIEDLSVCFVDTALNGGSYNTKKGLLVTRYSSQGLAVALSYAPGTDPCGDLAADPASNRP